MITVHHLERSRSHRVLWLLEELGFEYSIERYLRDPKTMRAPAALRAIHPLGKSPVVTIDDEVFAESGAILEELVERGAGLRPEPGTADFRRYRFFLHYAEGSLMPPLLVRLITDQLKTKRIPFFVRPITGSIAGRIDSLYTGAEIALHLNFLNQALTERPFLCGEALTAADVQMSFPLEAAMKWGSEQETYPKIQEYLETLRARPAYQRALELGGPVLL